MIEVDAVGFVYLLEVLKDLEQKASVYYVRPKCKFFHSKLSQFPFSDFLIKTLRHEGIRIGDHQVCETPSDAIRRAEMRLMHGQAMDLLDGTQTLGVVQF
jgi:hypothetical protein